jgi:hypothetical protein
MYRKNINSVIYGIKQQTVVLIKTKCGKGHRMYVPLVFLGIDQRTQMQVLSVLDHSLLDLSLLNLM